jgi:hypothetical protein
MTPEQKVWFDDYTKRHPDRVNPCVRAYGLGPEGEICGNCSHLYRNVRSKVYLKCDLRTHTNGPGSDHRSRWPACGKFEDRDAETLTPSVASPALVFKGDPPAEL